MLTAMPMYGHAEETLFFASDVHSNTDGLCSLLRSSCIGSYEVVCLVGDHGGPGGGSDPATMTQYNQYSVVTVQVIAPSDGAGNWFAENKVSAKQLATIDTEKGDETLSDIQRKAIYLLDTANVAFPGQEGPATLALYDDGTHGDSAVGDGIYTNQYSDMVKEGTYSFAFEASGSVYEGDIFSREKLIQKYIVVNTSSEHIALEMMFSGVVASDYFTDYLCYRDFCYSALIWGNHGLSGGSGVICFLNRPAPISN
jgi:hypothetical protein